MVELRDETPIPAERRLVEAAIGSRASGTAQTIRSLGQLPQDLLQEASGRLGIACMLWAGLFSFALFMNNVVGPRVAAGTPLDDAWPWPGNPIAIAVILVSLGLFAYTRRRGCDCEFALDVGLVYEVFLALAIGVLNQWTPNTIGVSWICVLILVHPLIVPNTAPKTALAAFLAASMDPVGLAISAARGVELPSVPVLVWTYTPNYICAFLAVLSAHIITRLGRQVSRARELGSYRVGDLLGRGGMGEVYRATHRMLARPAAIKLIKPEALGDGGGRVAEVVLHRFRREAEVAASLRSPHTIELYDFGVAADGGLYYVMELLEGLDLESLIVRFGPIPAERVIHLLIQASHSLSEAHAENLIHRDIKPANLYTCRMGLDLDFVKVLDFGLVKFAGPQGVNQSLATAPGATAGTPAFMAPEVAMGESGLDGRVDIYALGCVGYWLLTGRMVFDADTAIKMMFEQINTKPVPPSQRTEIEVPPELDAVILSCLEKKKDDRPATAAELAARLAAIEVRDPWTQERAARWWNTHLPSASVSLPAALTA